MQMSSEYYDFETGLNYYNYRYYSTEQGIWLQRDPLYESSNINLYLYTHNSPIQYIDITGKREHCVNMNIGSLQCPAFKAYAQLGVVAVDWDFGATLSFCASCEKISGSGQLYGNVGLTLGMAYRGKLMGYDLWAMLGIRAYANISTGGSISGSIDPKTCKKKIEFVREHKITIGAEGGAIARLSKVNKLKWEVGIGMRIEWSAAIGVNISCTDEDCTGSLYAEADNNLNIKLFANFGFFDYEMELNPQISDNKLRVESPSRPFTIPALE